MDKDIWKSAGESLEAPVLNSECRPHTDPMVIAAVEKKNHPNKLWFILNGLQIVPTSWPLVVCMFKFKVCLCSQSTTNRLKNETAHPTCSRRAPRTQTSRASRDLVRQRIYSPPCSSPPCIAFIEFWWTVTEAGTLLLLRRDLFISHYHTFTSGYSLARAVVLNAS